MWQTRADRWDQTVCADKKDRRRAGFSAIEVVVVVSVVSLLLTLLLPAILAAREAARMADCGNRLRQLGVALSRFESSHKTLPTGLRRDAVRHGGVDSLPVQIQLLPFVGEAALSTAVDDAESRRAILHNFGTGAVRFRCPSEVRADVLNYRVCTGAVPSMFEEPFGAGGGGAFPFTRWDRGVSLAAVRDGLSNTVAMSERVASDRHAESFHSVQDMWYSGLTLLGVPTELRRDADAMTRLCEERPEDPGQYYNAALGRFRWDASFANSAYNHVLPPGSTVTDCTVDQGSVDLRPVRAGDLHSTVFAAVSARSHHREGAVNVLLLDGSLRVAGRSTDVELWRRLATRADADPVSF